MAKKLTLNTLNSLDSKLNTKKKVYVVDGQYEILIDTKFRKSKIDNVIYDYLLYYDELQKSPDITQDSLKSFPVVLLTLMCKHFSSLPIEYDNVSELIIVANKLYDLGILEQLFSGEENGFNKDEVKNIEAELEKRSKTIGEKMGEVLLKATLNETGEEENGVLESE